MMLRGVTVARCLRLAVLSILLLSIGCSETDIGIDDLPPLPEEISSLPIGILIEPEQSIVEAQHYDGTYLSGLTGPNIHTWDRTLTISALDSEVRVIQYGVFGWHEGHWIDVTDEQKPYTAEELAEVLDCEDAILRVGESYISDSFGNVSNVLRDTPVFYRWYFIGEADGNRVRGEVTLMDLPPAD